MRRTLSLTAGTALLGMLSAHSSSAQSSSSALPDAPSASQAAGNSPGAAPSLTLGPDYGPLPATPLTAGQKGKYYVKRSFGPGQFVAPLLVGAYLMANPRSDYPREWRQGAGAYGRNVGAAFGQNVTANTGRFVTGFALHEDPRYYPSENRAFLPRVTHAILFTVVDRSDGGRPRPAFSNFAGAAAGGFVGNAYLPDPYANATHAGQRSAVQLGGFAAENLQREFRPELRQLARKLHLPAQIVN